jgi:nucleotide-binding universal stress UspA family protein
MLDGWCRTGRNRGLECNAVVREGHAAQEILSAARQFRADRLLLGTRSRSKLGKLFLGSVAEQVLRSVHLPVITVGPEAHLPMDEGGREPAVLYATTLGETSRPSAALACQVASSQSARLVLLHVLPPAVEMERKGLPTGLDSAALHELRRMADETGAGCCSKVDAKVLHGNPAIEILSEAAQSHTGLIILGATQRPAFENLTRDRTVYRVLAHARCPVLTLREPAQKSTHAEIEAVAAHF